jgi:hypothetical protein
MHSLEPGVCKCLNGRANTFKAMVPAAVFSEGDMQAVQERAEKAEAAYLNAGLAYRREQARAAVVAEALRDLLEVAERMIRFVRLGKSGKRPFIDGIARAKASLEGVDRSHELVPLGTQEAVRELLDALDRAGAIDRWQPLAEPIAAVQALVEGVERTHTPSGPLRERVADMLAENDAAGTGPVSRSEYLADADALIALVVGVGPSEGHTLVPNEVCDAAGIALEEFAELGESGDCGHWPAELVERPRKLGAALREAARGGRPQWPGTGETA